jgi:hypothetical protein
MDHIYLRGQPKSGTTWLEVVLKSLVGTCCQPPSCRLTDYNHTDMHSHRSVGYDLPAKNAAGARSVKVQFFAPGYPSKHAMPVQIQPEDPHKQYLTPSIILDKHADWLLTGCLPPLWRSIWTDGCLQHALVWPPKPMIGAGAAGRPAAYLLILRDPRAVTVSWFHWRNHSGKGLSIDSGLLASAAHVQQVLYTAAHMAAAVSLRYVAHSRFTNRTLTLFYEDLLSDPRQPLHAAARHLGLPPPSGAQIDAILGPSSIEAMREAEAAGELPALRTGQRYVRTATADGWAAEVGTALAAKISRAVCTSLVEPLRGRWLDCDAYRLNGSVCIHAPWSPKCM